MSQEERLFRHLQHMLAQQENPAPHAIAYTRRQFFKRAVAAGFSVTAIASVLAACGSDDTTPTARPAGGGSGTTASPAASPAAVNLPEITSIPENLKGTGEVRVVSYGGAFQEAQRRAYFEPFQRLSGIRVVEAEGPDAAKIKAMVDTKNYQWDVAELGRNSVIQLERQGDYWETINYDLFDTANIDEGFRYKYSVDMLPFAQIYAYRTDTVSGDPSGWADFWNIDKFDGPRTLPGASGGSTPDLEAAIQASGVAMDQVYPIDINKAFDSLSKIKPEVTKWWETGAQCPQMLTDKEVVMGIAWNGRIAAIQAQGVPVKIAWPGGTLRNDCWAIPKGAPNATNAQKFTAFITMPIPQARLSMLIPYGFVNNKSTEHIPADRLAILPTAPDIRDQLLLYNYNWWADNREQVIQRFNTWVLS